jgi:hypothetical protein
MAFNIQVIRLVCLVLIFQNGANSSDLDKNESAPSNNCLDSYNNAESNHLSAGSTCTRSQQKKNETGIDSKSMVIPPELDGVYFFFECVKDDISHTNLPEKHVFFKRGALIPQLSYLKGHNDGFSALYIGPYIRAELYDVWNFTGALVVIIETEDTPKLVNCLDRYHINRRISSMKLLDKRKESSFSKSYFDTILIK